MSENPLLELIEKQEWVQPGLDECVELIKNTFAAAGPVGQTAKNALHGVWLGHSLHPALTDIPIGSWTVAAVLDLFETRGECGYQPGADFAVMLGLVGAVPAALSGMTDWSDTHGKPQRLGALHGILNLSATALYAGSYAARKSHKRGIGKALGYLGYGLMLVSAYLGGELSHGEKIGVNHAPDPEGELPADYTPATSESELVEGVPIKVTIHGTDILIVKQSQKIYALADKCSHLGGPLSEGRVEGDFIICPWHASRFCLRDGRVKDGPATSRQPILDVQLQSGEVMVKAHQR